MNEISDKPSWIQFWQGKFSRSFLTHKYWIIWFGIYLIPLFISYFFYQGNYSILTNYISDLGDPYNNPIGWPIWAFGHICLGLLYIPFIGYLWRELSKEPRKGFKPGMFFLILTGFGVFGLGAFPQFNYPGIDVLHVMDAAFFIAGSFFSMCCWMPWQRKEPQMNQIAVWARLIICIVPLAGIVIGGLFMMFGNSAITGCGNGDCSGILRTSLWEWMILASIIINNFILIQALPRQPLDLKA